MTLGASLLRFKLQIHDFKGLVLVLGLLVSGCSERPEIGELKMLSGRTMGTTYSVSYRHVVSVPSAKLLKEDIDERLRAFNLELSTYIEDSDISRFNKLEKGKTFKLGRDFFSAYSGAMVAEKASLGAFDPTVMPLVNLWGFGPEGPKKVPEKDQLESVVKFVGMDKLIFKPELKTLLKKDARVELDFSASAKGLGVDRVAELLESYKVNDYLVEIGGEMRVAGDKGEAGPWVVAIEAPGPSEKRVAQKVLTLDQDYALATSGSYRNFYQQEGKMYQHTLNPATGRPVESDLVSVSVLDLDKSCMMADAWATALMVMGAEKAKQMSVDLNLAVYLIIQEGREERRFIEFESPRFKNLMNQQSPLEGI
jgi:thiamine biosynthesis lipoprotein